MPPARPEDHRPLHPRPGAPRLTAPASLAALAALCLALPACSTPPAAAPAPPASTPAAAAPAGPPTAPPSTGPGTPPHQFAVERMIADAERLLPTVKSDAAKLFLSRAKLLPKIPTRALFRSADKTKAYTEAEALALPEAERAALQPLRADEELYYTSHYGSPLSYSRPLDILFSRGITLPPGAKLLDFGYGYIGHLRMLATMGVDATGVDVNPVQRALYSMPGDQGPITGPLGERGSVRVVNGYFPSDPKIVADVGGGYDLVISKNVLKRGYIHPERPVDDKILIHLGVSDEVVLETFFDAMAPGAHFLIYNICPAPTPPDKPFVPWSDGRSPFTRAQFEAAGFEVLVFDQDDAAAVRVMGHLLAWDLPQDGEPGWDFEHDLSVLYTLVRKPPAPKHN